MSYSVIDGLVSSFHDNNGSIATKLAKDGQRVSAHSGYFCDGTKIDSSRRQMARLRPNLHTMISTWTRIQGVLKVKVTGTWLTIAQKSLLLPC